MATLALALLDGTMEMFFIGKFFFDVSQGGATQIVLVVAAQARRHLVEGKESLVLGIVCRVAGAAAAFLLQGLVRYRHSCQLFAHLAMASGAEIRHLFFEQVCNRRPMGIVAGTAGAVLDRRMSNLCFFQGFGEISVALEA